MEIEKWSIQEYNHEIEIGNDKDELICSFPSNNKIYMDIAETIVLVPEMKQMLIKCRSALRRENQVDMKQLQMLIDKLEP